MKHWIACSLSLFVLVITGCDTVNHAQLQVIAPHAERGVVATTSSSERDVVKQVITEIAVRWRLEDRTSLSLTPETICSYAQVDVKHPISIKAWVASDRVSIDIFQPPPEVGESGAYQNFRNEVMSALKKQFGERLKQVQKLDQVSGGASKS